MNFAKVQGHALEYQWIGSESAASDIILLHEGLGSISMWRDFPRRLSDATGRRVLVYSRYGYGQSSALLEARKVDFMHCEALQALPELLDQLGVHNPILLGHSDGASIALIHAAALQRPVRGVIAIAPHVFVEDLTVRSIRAVRQDYETTDLRQKLARHHADVDSAFRGWNDIWLHLDFRNWNIERLMESIECPVLVIQGEDDEYGSMAQIESIARQVRVKSVLKLDRCGHAPHRDQLQKVLASVNAFCQQLA